MLPKYRSSGKGFTTEVTRVRSFSSMCHRVLLQFACLVEHLAALLAHERGPLFVLPEDVLVQILLGDHSSVAYVALELGLVVLAFLMHVQGVAVVADLAADVADQRYREMLEAYVRSQVALDFKFLAAELAGESVLGRVFAFDVHHHLAPLSRDEVALVALELVRCLLSELGRLNVARMIFTGVLVEDRTGTRNKVAVWTIVICVPSSSNGFPLAALLNVLDSVADFLGQNVIVLGGDVLVNDSFISGSVVAIGTGIGQ